MEYLPALVTYLSPVVLAGLLVFWVYNIHRGLLNLNRKVDDSNNAVAQAFNALAAKVNGPTSASTPEAQ